MEEKNMAEAIKRADPTGWIARQFLSPGTAVHLPIVVDKVTLGTGTANGGFFSWQNPYDVAGFVTAVVTVTTAGTWTAGVDIGVGTLSGSADNIIDAGRIDTVDPPANGSKKAGPTARL